jgi:hypothetical protein
MKRYGHAEVIVNDLLRSYRAAMNLIGNAVDGLTIELKIHIDLFEDEKGRW